MNYSYLEAISKGFPTVQCYCVGDGNTYESLVWSSGPPIPLKETLDEWIANNVKDDTDKRITVFAFRNRFTIEEKINMDLLSIDNPASTIQERQIAATIRVIVKDTDSASFIDLASENTIKGVRAFESFGLLTKERADAILNGAISEYEKLSYLGYN